MEKIILASYSPRRKELLELIGLNFTIHPSRVKEEITSSSPFEIVEELALLKAKDVANYYQNGFIIGADTIVVHNDQILGKPADEDNAFAMLSQLQGDVHYVYSGIAIINATTKQTLVSHQVTKVFMKRMTVEEINVYIKTREPMDKAGAYGIQGFGSMIIERIEGDYFNVVGLSLSLLESMFKSLNINLLTDFIQS